MTLKNHLDDRILVSLEEYQNSRKLDPLQGASWAIWGETTDDLSLFKDAHATAPRLRKDVVLIGANFGLLKNPGSEPFASFQNFHAKGSRGDSKLRSALTGTPLEGAFITDLIKDYPTKYANGLAKEIRAGRIDVTKHVKNGFREEQEALGLDRSTLYIPIGNSTRTLWNLLVKENAIPADQRVFHHTYGGGPEFRGKPVLNLRHYSGPVNLVAAVEALLAQRRLPLVS